MAIQYTKNSYRRLSGTAIGLVTNERTRQDFPGQHKAIIDAHIFEAAQKLLQGHTIRSVEAPYGANKHGFLFKGLIRCGECRSAIINYVQPRKNKVYRYYKCIAKVNGLPSKCPMGKSFGAQKLEEYVVEKLAAVGYDRGLLERVVKRVKELSRQQIEPLESERRDVLKRLESVQQEIRNLLDLVRDHGANEEVSQELGRLKVVKSGLEVRAGELEAKIGHRKQPLYDVDVIQGTLQRFASLIYRMPVDLRVRAVGLLVKQVTVFKKSVRVELHELPIADLQRALDTKMGKGPPLNYTTPKGDPRWESNVNGGGTGLQQFGKSGGDGGSQPVNAQSASLFQNAENDAENITFFPSFELSWALSWGRIANGEKVIEDAAADPVVALPGLAGDFPTEKFTTPAVHERWEQNVNPSALRSPWGPPSHGG